MFNLALDLNFKVKSHQMRFWNIFVFLFLAITNLQAFSSADSLIQALPSVSGIEKVDLLNDISWALKYSKNDLAAKYAKQGLLLADKNDYLNGAGRAFLNLSVIKSIDGNYDLSNEYASNCIEKYRELNDAFGMAKGWNVLGVNQQNRGNFDSAFSYLEKALTLFKTLADTSSILKVEGNIANVHYSQGNYEKALESYNILIDFGKRNRDTIMWSSNLLNAGNSYSFLGNHANALEYLFASLDLDRLVNDTRGEASSLNGIALIFHRLSMYDEAEKMFLDALKIYEESKNYKYMGITYNNLGNIYLRRKQYDKGLKYYRKTLDFYQKAKVNSKGNTLINIAKIHRETDNLELSKKTLFEAIAIDSSINRISGLALAHSSLGQNYLIEKNYVEAEKNLLKSYKLWSEIGQIKDLANTAGLLSNLYEEKGDLEKALKYRTEYKETQDEVYGISSQKEVMQILLEREKVESKISNRQSSPLNQKGPLLYILIIGSVLGLLIWILLRRKKIDRSLNSDQNASSMQNLGIENLKSSLGQKNMEVAFLSLTIIQKDEFIQHFYQKMQSFANKYPQNREAQKILNSLHLQDVNSNNWDFFKQTFEQISPNFFDNLFHEYPGLSNKELRHCALIRLNIPTKEIAQILGISMSGVHKARYRLRKQFSLERSESLENYLASI